MEELKKKIFNILLNHSHASRTIATEELYELFVSKSKPGPRWVKAKDRLPGWARFVEWRHESKVSAGKDTVLGIAKRGVEYFRSLEWYDESAAGREEDLK